MSVVSEKETSGPAYERVIRARPGLISLNFEELWQYRELFVFLAWRDIIVRYKQTYIGIAWAVLQPFLTTVVFTVVFGMLAKVPSHGAPYAVMSLAGVVPWFFFANAMRESSNSLIASQNMITKVYFPRLIIPSSAVLSGLVDFGVGMLILFCMMVWYGVSFSPLLLLLPFFFFMAFLAAFAVGLWLSALNVKYRDVKYIVPFLTQMGFFVSPVGLTSSAWRDHFGLWYDMNPMVGVIDGFRWCVLGGSFEPHWTGFWLSLSVTVILMISGALYFRNTEKSFADII